MLSWRSGVWLCQPTCFCVESLPGPWGRPGCGKPGFTPLLQLCLFFCSSDELDFLFPPAPVPPFSRPTPEPGALRAERSPNPAGNGESSHVWGLCLQGAGREGGISGAGGELELNNRLVTAGPCCTKAPPPHWGWELVTRGLGDEGLPGCLESRMFSEPPLLWFGSTLLQTPWKAPSQGAGSRGHHTRVLPDGHSTFPWVRPCQGW